VSEEWSYRAFRVRHGDIPKRARYKGMDWYIEFSDGDIWIGFDEIMNKLGEKGWDIFSVTADFWGSDGNVRAYMLFAKKPK
jgi:hypothetical protein